MKKIAIIGGGAAGFFAALRAAEINKKSTITIYEQGGQLLKKVRISGGGRCNVTHNLFDTQKFSTNYPRGERELRSPLQQFQALDTVNWFKAKGIKLVTESDGRMFPSTNTSETIINCFLDYAKKYKIEIIKNKRVVNIKKKSNDFDVEFNNQEIEQYDSVLICTGSSNHGYVLAENLGHTITNRAPSLFSFKTKNLLFKDLSGISFPNVRVKLKIDGSPIFKQSGPILITHWGLSGPAILKLSAWAAREMKGSSYKANLTVEWIPQEYEEKIIELKKQNLKSNIANAYPTILPKRFWENLLIISNIPADTKWADISKKQINLIKNNLFNFECSINGQNRFKEEFVECGGINTKEVNFKTMESKIVSNLFFAGEILDIDGITGGFNFQNAWTTGWIAASNF